MKTRLIIPVMLVALLILAGSAATLADNNLVTTLLNIRSASKPAYTITRKRDGWLFIVADEVESMRWVKAGKHEIEAAAGKPLLVRAIPEIVHSGLGYHPSPFLASYPKYSVAYLEKIGVFANANVILERKPDPDFDIAKWRASGKQIRVRASSAEAEPAGIYDYWTNHRGMHEPYDGIQMSEYDGWKGSPHLKDYHYLSDAVRKIAGEPRFAGKRLVPYTTAMYNSPKAMNFLETLFKHGHHQAVERYIPEQATLAEAKKQLYWMSTIIDSYRKKLRGSQRRSIMALGYMSAPPETLDRYPGANYLVFMDMQMRALAVEGTYKGLYGVMWYHTAYADEEALRWSVKLIRHYCIEGKTGRLTKAPYILRHLKNGDFANKTIGWKLAPAEPGKDGSMAVRKHESLSVLETRYTKVEQGETFLWTRRNAEKPNRFSQTIRLLKPGQTYSLRMMVCDYRDLIDGRDRKQEHKPMVSIEGAQMLPDQSFREVFRSGRAGHAHGKFNRDNNLWITYHRLIFRAEQRTAKLTISDWQSPTDPGPADQELTFNYLSVQPYMEE
jgi:hypothetical protein